MNIKINVNVPKIVPKKCDTTFFLVLVCQLRCLQSFLFSYRNDDVIIKMDSIIIISLLVSIILILLIGIGLSNANEQLMKIAYFVEPLLTMCLF